MKRGGTYMKYARNVYSQNGEDGILAEIFNRLEIKEGHCVEFGTGNGRDLSNTLALIEQGWTGVWIEQNEESFGKAKALGDSLKKVTTLYGTVGFGPEDNLDKFLSRAMSGGFPQAYDLCSIDIDSYDLQVWRASMIYRPKVVVIEINSAIPLGVEQEHVGGDSGKQGASFTSMVKLGLEKGYQPVCHTGNVIFVERKYVGRLEMPSVELNEPHVLFNDMWARWAEAAEKK